MAACVGVLVGFKSHCDDDDDVGQVVREEEEEEEAEEAGMKSRKLWK